MSLQFSDTTDKLGIIQECETMTSLGDANISGVTNTLKQFTRYANTILSRVWHVIFQSYGGWQYDDANQSDLPIATDSLVSGQSKYAFPTGTLTIRGVEIKDESGQWHRLDPLNEELIRETGAVTEFEDTDSLPKYYRLAGETMFLHPAPNYSQAASLKVFIDRGSVAFASTDTTQTPGFAGEYHDILPLGMSTEWLDINKPNDPTGVKLEKKYEKRLQQLGDFYQMRYQQMFPPKIHVRDQTRIYT